MKAGVPRKALTQLPTLQGDTFDHFSNSDAAQPVVLSEWQELQGFGILYLSVIAGVMNWNVWDRTNEPGTPSLSIFGMWQAMH